MTKTKQPETTIIRGVRSSEHPYVQIARSAAQDSRLSFDARGMLLYLFSKPDDWHIREKDLMNASQAGRAKTRRIMKELQMYGYLTKHPSLADVPRDDKGHAQYPPLKIYDIPEIQPESENQTTGNQTTGNRTHTVLKKVQIKEDTKKETTPPNGVVPAVTDSVPAQKPVKAKATKQDLLWDAIEDTTHHPARLDKLSAGQVGQIKKKCVELGITPERVPGLFQHVDDKMKGWDVKSYTAGAIIKHAHTYNDTEPLLTETELNAMLAQYERTSRND